MDAAEGVAPANSQAKGLAEPEEFSGTLESRQIPNLPTEGDQSLRYPDRGVERAEWLARPLFHWDPEMTLKTTPLNAAHKAAGARTVDFGGWDMPVNYGSQIEEHHAVRREWGLFDVSHMLAVDLEGAGAREFLRRALANDVAKLKVPGKALYSCMLNEEGGVIDDLIAYFF